MSLYQNGNKIIPYVAGKTIASAWIDGEKVYEGKKSKWTKATLSFPIKEVGKVGNVILGIFKSGSYRYLRQSFDGGISFGGTATS